MKIYAAGRNAATHDGKKKQIKTVMIPLRASIKHPINVYIFGYIHCSDWLNAWNNKGQCNVLYCSFFLWIAAFSGNLPGCWLFTCCLTSERFKTMGKCVSSKMWLQKPLWHCIKSGYEESRLRAPWCIVCINVVDISSMGELALTSHLKGKKHQRLTSQKRSLASVPDCFGVSS